MRIKTKISIKESLVTLGVALIMLSGDFVPSEIASGICFLFLLALLIRKPLFGSDELALILPLSIILLTGTISSLFHGMISSKHSMFLLAKDLWYYTKPIIYLLTGLYLFRNGLGKERMMKILIYITLIISLHHIIRVVVFVAGADPASLVLDRLRYKTGPGNLLESFLLAYSLIFLKKSGLDKKLILPSWLLITILSLSLILSFSRTLILTFIIAIIAMKNFFSFRLRTFTKSVIIVFIVVVAGILGVKYLHKISNRNGIVFAMTDKLLNSVTEITYGKSNPDFREINANWRGLETGLTRSVIKNGNTFEKIFGFGFGKTVFVSYRGLQGIDDPNIPKFHNGFMEIMLKTGYLGLLFYILFFIVAFRAADSKWPPGDNEMLLKSIIVSAFVCTLIITGLYNKAAFDPSLLLAGYLTGLTLNGLRQDNSKEQFNGSAKNM